MEVFGLGLKIKEEGAATVEASIKRLGAELAKTAFTVASITKAMQLFVRETAESQRVQAQLATALRSTNNVSGQTIDVLNQQAAALMNVTAFGDEAIGSAQALLLTFTNIREVFPQATVAVLDLAQALQMDARSAAMMLGKALNDPLLGVTALRRAGVQLSEAQQQMVKDFVAANDIVSAQRIILQELATQVGGSAQAYRNTLGGALQALTEAFGNLFEASEKTGASMTGTVNALTSMVNVLRGPIQFVFTAFTNGLVTIASLVGQVGLAITRFFAAIGAAAATFIGAFGVLLPGVGDNIGRFIDDLNAKVASNDEYFASLQDRLRNWRNEVVAGTTAANNFSTALGTVNDAVATGVGGAGRPSIEELGQRTAATAFTTLPPGGERLRRQEILRGLVPQFGAIALTEAQALAVQLQTTFQETIGNALVGGIVGGIEQAVASGNISDGFKALSSMLLAGIGDAMIKFGTSTAAFSQFMAKITAALTSLNPAAGLAASLALIGVGAALKGAARGMFGGQGGGNAGSIANFGGNLGGFASATPTTQIIFGQTSATTAAGMQPRQAMNVTIIGPNDPQAQRALQEMMTKANSRGRIG